MGVRIVGTTPLFDFPVGLRLVCGRLDRRTCSAAEPVDRCFVRPGNHQRDRRFALGKVDFLLCNVQEEVSLARNRTELSEVHQDGRHRSYWIFPCRDFGNHVSAAHILDAAHIYLASARRTPTSIGIPAAIIGMRIQRKEREKLIDV